MRGTLGGKDEREEAQYYSQCHRGSQNVWSVVEFAIAVTEDTAIPSRPFQSWRTRMHRFMALVGTLGLLLVGRPATAETKVTISDTHLCCGQCLRAVDSTLKDMAGVKFKSDQGAKTIEITADND